MLHPNGFAIMEATEATVVADLPPVGALLRGAVRTGSGASPGP